MTVNDVVRGGGKAQPPLNPPLHACDEIFVNYGNKFVTANRDVVQCCSCMFSIFLFIICLMNKVCIYKIII